jgi:hypothetical protein
VHADHIEEFAADLRLAIDEVEAAGVEGDQGAYGSID